MFVDAPEQIVGDKLFIDITGNEFTLTTTFSVVPVQPL
jgi:predicted HAD superfamily phosphohydrolase YqeG